VRGNAAKRRFLINAISVHCFARSSVDAHAHSHPNLALPPHKVNKVRLALSARIK
jgi:hypothetical protein